jgi:hypothetical protein
MVKKLVVGKSTTPAATDGKKGAPSVPVKIESPYSKAKAAGGTAWAAGVGR